MQQNFSDLLMKRVLLDENFPQPLRLELSEFDVLLTGDQNLRYQQNLSDRNVAIVELPFTRLSQILSILPDITEAIKSSTYGDYTRIKRK